MKKILTILFLLAILGMTGCFFRFRYAGIELDVLSDPKPNNETTENTEN